MMGENVKKETVDYLPLGSVVILKGGVQKVVVIAIVIPPRIILNCKVYGSH